MEALKRHKKLCVKTHIRLHISKVQSFQGIMVVSNIHYYMAISVSGQDESNPSL